MFKHINSLKRVKFECKANNPAKQVFNAEVEQNLLKYIKAAARLHYEMSTTEMRELAYRHATSDSK
jgi:hypothetical protein